MRSGLSFLLLLSLTAVTAVRVKFNWNDKFLKAAETFQLQDLVTNGANVAYYVPLFLGTPI
jgi:hypothetical protein